MAQAARNRIANVIRNDILAKSKALGNTKYGLKEVCSDLVNKQCSDAKSRRRLAEACFLSPNTVDRVASLKEGETGIEYRPQADTLERILREFGAEIHFETVNITGKYGNKAKE